MIKSKINTKELLFLTVLTLSELTTHSNVLGFYGGTSVPIILKLIIIMCIVGIATYINADNERLMCKYPPIIINAILPILIFDYYITELSGTILLYKIWWLGAIFVSEATIFIVLTLYNASYYDKFYKSFWKSITPTFIFTFIICFIRKPYSIERTINLIPFNRGFKFLMNFLKNPSATFENPLYFFGNIIFFIPLPFIIRNLIPKLKNWQLLLMGLFIPFIIESYQYIFSCGDVDIDDLILNWLGFGIGLLIEIIIKRKLLRNS